MIKTRIQDKLLISLNLMVVSTRLKTLKLKSLDKYLLLSDYLQTHLYKF